MRDRKIVPVVVSEEEAARPYRHPRITEATADKPFVKEDVYRGFRKALHTFARDWRFVSNPNEFYAWFIKQENLSISAKDSRGQPLWMVLFRSWETRKRYGGNVTRSSGWPTTRNKRAFGD